MTFKTLEPGKLYRVTWTDITEEPSGHPDQAVPKTFKHTYHFFDRRYIIAGKRKIPYLIFTAGEPPEFLHSICIPEGCISKVEVI